MSSPAFHSVNRSRGKLANPIVKIIIAQLAMSEYLLFLPLVVAFGIASGLCFHQILKLRRPIVSCRRAKPSLADEVAETKRLIGEDRYDLMSRKVDRILDEHGGEMSISVGLTTGPESDRASRELHSLLPGDTLNLVCRGEDHLDSVDVYSNGFRIGSLMLEDAREARELILDNVVTGVYVSEQNCYDDPSILALKLIMFYRKLKKRRVVPQLVAGCCLVVLENSTTLSLCQN